MPARDPSNIPLLTYAWVIGLSMWAGFVGYYNRLRVSDLRFSVLNFVGEVMTSGFAGVLVFWLCQAMGIGGLTTAALVGISGHMGGRAMAKLESVMLRNLGAGSEK